MESEKLYYSNPFSIGLVIYAALQWCSGDYLQDPKSVESCTCFLYGFRLWERMLAY